MTTRSDVIVVGAGFAGLAAARELAGAGKQVLVLEARDRIGGRTWLDERMGLELEIGGTWVHWTQPHVWAELTRYGLGLAPSPVPEKAYWWDGQRQVAGTPDEFLAVVGVANDLLAEPARLVFPQPYAPLDSPLLDAHDDISVRQAIAALPLTAEQRVSAEAYWSLNFNGSIDDAAYTQLLRWVALTGGDWLLCFEACATYKIQGGTRALAAAIQADAVADGFTEFRHDVDVRRVERTEAGVRVSAADGEEFVADEVVLTVPLQALDRITVEPPLPEAVQQAAQRGQVGRGAKIWFTVEGEQAPFVALGSPEWPLTFIQREYVHQGRTFLIGFGPDGTAIDPEDSQAVQEVVDRMVPGLKVLESSGHSWVGDEFSQETWPMHRTGFLTGSLAALQEPHDRLQLAGSDVAQGWGGFIDGALESGMTAARRILNR